MKQNVTKESNRRNPVAIKHKVNVVCLLDPKHYSIIMKASLKCMSKLSCNKKQIANLSIKFANVAIKATLYPPKKCIILLLIHRL